MMKRFFLVVSMILLRSNQIFSQMFDDYSWREYTSGAIPKDAFVAGRDVNGNNIYIGQAHAYKSLLPVGVYAEDTRVFVPSNAVTDVSISNVKIFCTPVPKKFSWNKTTAATLHVDLIEHRPIIGGYETGGYLFIGRVSVGADVKIGKILQYNMDNATMFFVNNHRQSFASTYEVLLYNEIVEPPTTTTRTTTTTTTTRRTTSEYYTTSTGRYG